MFPLLTDVNKNIQSIYLIKKTILLLPRLRSVLDGGGVNRKKFTPIKDINSSFQHQLLNFCKVQKFQIVALLVLLTIDGTAMARTETKDEYGSNILANEIFESSNKEAQQTLDQMQKLFEGISFDKNDFPPW